MVEIALGQKSQLMVIGGEPMNEIALRSAGGVRRFPQTLPFCNGSISGTQRRSATADDACALARGLPWHGAEPPIYDSFHALFAPSLLDH